MRIQQTDKILKEARNARHNNKIHTEPVGVMTRIWRSVTSLFGRREHA
jgi:hypothetical protein